MDGSGRRVGTRFGPYELRALLGQGGMGEVYEAFDTSKHRLVAVKLLSEALAEDPSYQERFRRESQAAARLAEPHVIPIHDWGEIDGVLFLDMRLVAGSDLSTILHRTGPLDPARAVRLVEQVAAALDAAHAQGLVHRDVKPANILVTDADFAYLADFGIAHTEGDSAITQVGMALGSYIYMAPERFDSGPVTGRSDIYSLACVLVQCLTGAPPFAAGQVTSLVRAHTTEPPPRVTERVPGLPPALDTVIATAMAKNPADRYPTALEFTRAARAALGMRETGTAPVTAPAPGPGAGGPGVFGPDAAAPATGAVPVTTGTGPTFVVHAPDPSRFGGKSEPGVASTLLPPESTGEVSAVIHPTGPTEIRASEFEFGPLPGQEQQQAPAFPTAAPASGAIPQVRPFPDAHLYEEGKRPEDVPASAPIPAVPPAVSTPVSAPVPPAAPVSGVPPVSRPSTPPRPSGPISRPQSPAFAETGRGDQPYSDEHPSGTYRVPAGFAEGAAESTRQYDAPASGAQGYVGAPAYSSDEDRDELIAPATTRYPAPPVREIPQPAPETRRYPAEAEPHPGAGNYPPAEDGYDAPYGRAYSARQEAYADPYPPQPEPYGAQRDPYAHDEPYGPRPDPYAAQAGPYAAQADPYAAQADPYGAQPDPYAAQGDPYGGHHDPYAGQQDPYAQQGRYDADQGYREPYDRREKRSPLLAVLAGCAVLAVLAVGSLVLWRVLGGDGEDTAAAPATTATTANFPVIGGGGDATAPTTSAGRPSGTTTTTTTPVRLPAGSTPCGGTSSAANGNAAAGNGVTSCPFAEEVRRAYAAQAGTGSDTPQTVTATSPVTGRSYTMTCTPSGGLVTCTGGDNAIVYVY